VRGRESQVQALARTQPVLLPMGLGHLEGVTHDYYRQGTTSLFAALDVLDGQVVTQCKPRHRHQEFLGFLKHLDASIPPRLEVHLIADNYDTHKHPKVKAWLASHPRYHMHYTPTYSSWLNQVERWFGLITQQAIRRGSFRNLKQLVQKIDSYVAHYNLYRRPFVSTASADCILAKLPRLCKVINGTSY
jgi:transposase